MNAFVTDFQEVWKYRSLLRMLVTRDLKTRYRNSVLGVAWSFLQPLGMMVVMSFAFNTVNRGDPSIQRFNVFLLSGLLPWNFFSAAVVGATGSIVANSSLVKKVYFPRLVLPVSVVVSSLVNFLLALPVWVLVAVASGHPLYATLVLVPLVILIQVVFSIGISFFLATLNVFYRDTQFILELVMLALFFLTPIWYDIGKAKTATLFGQTIDLAVWVRRLNPMASLVNLYQDLMYKGVTTEFGFVLRTALTAIVVLFAGYLVFRRFSPRFGEEV